MDDYLALRAQLVHADRAQRMDSLRMKNMSNLEFQAEAIVRTIRADEAVSTWGEEKTGLLDYTPNDTSTNLFPGMAFLTARDVAIHTTLFSIVQKMPKGALLHAHLGSMIPPRILLRLALAQPAIHVRVSGRLNKHTLNATRPDFKALPRTQYSLLSSITDLEYTPNNYVPLYKARENFDASLGGPDGFDRWVIDSLEIKPSEAYGSHNTTSKIWEKLNSVCAVSENLTAFMPVWEANLREFIMSSVDDGISYIESRVFFWSKYMIGADGLENVPHREWLIAYENIVDQVKDELKRQGRQDAFVGSKIIYTTMRSDSPQDLEWYTEDCLTLKREFPHLIVGFDVVGHEDSLRPLIDYAETLMKFKARQAELGLDIPLILHAGETLGDGTAADMNLYDAILLGAKRIGHGFSLVKHPALMNICKQRGIALEVCPISNEVLRLTSSMPMHPLAIMINHGIPITLSSDDPSLWGSTGLTYDFYQVLVSSEISGLITMGEIARDSLKYSCLGDEEKDRALALYEKQWTTFIQWVVQKFTTK